MQPIERSPSTTKTMTDLPTLNQAHFDELTQTVRGEVYRRGDHQCVVSNIVANNGAHLFCPHWHSGFKSVHAYSMETF